MKKSSVMILKALCVMSAELEELAEKIPVQVQNSSDEVAAVVAGIETLEDLVAVLVENEEVA